jgi:hypothetical protein
MYSSDIGYCCFIIRNVFLFRPLKMLYSHMIVPLVSHEMVTKYKYKANIYCDFARFHVNTQVKEIIFLMNTFLTMNCHFFQE